jgi:hypothetical protein
VQVLTLALLPSVCHWLGSSCETYHTRYQWQCSVFAVDLTSGRYLKRQVQNNKWRCPSLGNASMAVDVEDLIVQPFRELIQRGNEAIANAEAARLTNPEISQVMLRSARAVVREGERALQRVHPLLLDHLERHGDAFRDAVKECGKQDV